MQRGGGAGGGGGTDDGGATFSVAALEAAKWATHDAAYRSPSCGFDQWYDNHFSWQQFAEPVNKIATRVARAGNSWHCDKVSPSEIDVYAVDPTGDAIQIDGYFTRRGSAKMHDLGCFNSSNVLFDLCSQGHCDADDDAAHRSGDDADDADDALSAPAQQDPEQQQQQPEATHGPANMAPRAPAA